MIAHNSPYSCVARHNAGGVEDEKALSQLQDVVGSVGGEMPLLPLVGCRWLHHFAVSAFLLAVVFYMLVTAR